ncbi:hypothetical protein CEV34_4779 [Brucella pseudogrignonensis]|uniref:Uncharacterized protein n=1 Tax=Brucella pseudogrignonensis TaxID=419475 RepID=A0A256G4L5_9HYPH|nr:hypothetical protein CEV34_4779 [Brucella pseudogrignonensis]
MSSYFYRSYYEPVYSRVLREALRRSGYIIDVSPQRRTADLAAAKLLLDDFLIARRDEKPSI